MIPSHVAFVADISNVLAKRGHKVTVIDNILRSDISNKLDPNIIEKIVEVKMAENVGKLVRKREIPAKFWSMRNEPEEQREVMEQLGKMFLEQCKHLVLRSEVLTELRNFEFDFGMHEVFDTCGIGIFEKLKIRKSVILSSAGMRDIVNEALGISGPLQASSILADYGSVVPFWETRRNLKFHSAWRNFFEVQSKELEQLLGVEKSFEELLRYSNLMFVNTHELADCHRPWSRRVYKIGGISFKTPKDLNENYTSLFANFSSIVLISFGTTTPSVLMPEVYKTTFLNVFSKFPETLFIWKYEMEDVFAKSYTGNNVVFRKFVPQTDLLESGRISLFITHGGQNSLLESLHSRTRSLVIPLFGDQHRNAQIALENRLVHVLNKKELSNAEMVENAVKTGLASSDQRLEVNLRGARQTSETLLIGAIESTYAAVSCPPNFESFPRFHSSDVILLLLDFSVVAAASLIFVSMTVVDNIFRYDVENELSTDIHQIISVEPSPEVTNLLNTGSLPIILWNSKASPEEQRAIMEGLGHVHRLQCAHLVTNSTLIAQLQAMKFDFAIHEIFDSCGIGILEAAGIRKTVIVSSTGPMDVVPIMLGVSETLDTPSLLSDYGSSLSIHQKRRNLKFLSAMLNFHEMQETWIGPLFRKIHGIKRPFSDIMRQANLLFYNIHEGSDGMRMRGRRSFDIGGIAFKDQKNLTEEYLWLLSDPRPKVLVSFGTAATSLRMPENLKKSLLKAMKQMSDVVFIWKYEQEDEFTNAEAATSNVIFKKFMPQTDLLGSRKIALFITHCGQNSLLEAFHAGVRVLAVPLFGDQHRNARLAEENGLIEIMPKKDIEASAKVVTAVRKALERNERLESNLLHIASLLRNSKSDAESLLISTIESTYSNEFPPDFQKFPQNLHPNTIVLLIDILLATVFLVITFAAFKFLRKSFW
ncbi:unnamed protein product [Caenorhabditis sp. 36 PRJEB53466]|nr:unnamed protein product [Caenorhabditis sp. 36 PRJEB53466]